MAADSADAPGEELEQLANGGDDAVDLRVPCVGGEEKLHLARSLHCLGPARTFVDRLLPLILQRLSANFCK